MRKLVLVLISALPSAGFSADSDVAALEEKKKSIKIELEELSRKSSCKSGAECINFQLARCTNERFALNKADEKAAEEKRKAYHDTQDKIDFARTGKTASPFQACGLMPDHSVSGCLKRNAEATGRCVSKRPGDVLPAGHEFLKSPEPEPAAAQPNRKPLFDSKMGGGDSAR